MFFVVRLVGVLSRFKNILIVNLKIAYLYLMKSTILTAKENHETVFIDMGYYRVLS